RWPVRGRRPGDCRRPGAGPAGQGLTGGRIGVMTTTAAARAERLARARKEQGDRGGDALLLGPSADLASLTGYHPPHLERLTMLVVPAAGDPRLVVPALGAALAPAPAGPPRGEVG